MKCYFDSQPFLHKPSKETVPIISSRICTKLSDLSTKQFIKNIDLGKSLVPSVMFQNSRKQSNFMFTNLILLDFDNTVKVDGVYKKVDNYFSIDDCLNMEFTKNNAFILYESFSSTSEINRFRLVFYLKYPIISQEDFDLTYRKLLTIYPHADVSCNDSARLFFGAKKDTVRVINPKGVPDLDCLDTIALPKLSSKPKNTICNEPIVSLHDIAKFISDKNAKALSEHISSLGLSLKDSYSSEKSLWHDFNKLSMHKLFNLPYKTFNCIIYEDKNPSCSILRLDNGDFIYKRFSSSNEFALNNFSLFNKFFDGDYFELRDFILNIFGSKISAIYLKDSKISELILALKNKDTKKTHPRTFKILHRYAEDIDNLFKVMFNKSLLHTNKYLFLSFYSVRTLSEKVFKSNQSYKKVHNLLKFLEVLEIVKTLSDTEIINLKLKNFKLIKNEYNNRQNVYMLNVENIDIDFIEKTIYNLNLDASFVLSNMATYDFTDKKNPIKKITNDEEYINDLENWIISNLDSKPFVLDSEVRELFADKYGIKFMKKNYIHATDIILKRNNLKRNCLNINLIEFFDLNVDKKSKMKIIYKSSIT